MTAHIASDQRVDGGDDAAPNISIRYLRHTPRLTTNQLLCRLNSSEVSSCNCMGYFNKHPGDEIITGNEGAMVW